MSTLRDLFQPMHLAMVMITFLLVYLFFAYIFKFLKAFQSDKKSFYIFDCIHYFLFLFAIECRLKKIKVLFPTLSCIVTLSLKYQNFARIQTSCWEGLATTNGKFLTNCFHYVTIKFPGVVHSILMKLAALLLLAVSQTLELQFTCLM